MNGEDDILLTLLLQGDKGLTSMKNPEPRLIVVANAAFALYNMRQERNLHLPRLGANMFPVFYEVIVAAALGEAVQTGTFSNIKTPVLCYIPALPCKNSEGCKEIIGYGAYNEGVDTAHSTTSIITLWAILSLTASS